MDAIIVTFIIAIFTWMLVTAPRKNFAVTHDFQLVDVENTPV